MVFDRLTQPVNNPQNPCRAYAFMARDTAVAVILRRGPSDWVQLIRWQTTSDEIEYGQWFNGRVYERRCDLSPDGRLFLYFARKKNKRTMEDPHYTYAWTAVSRPPYFTALALWPKGNCWNGGGLFVDNQTIRLNHDSEQLAAHPDHQAQGLTIVQDFVGKGEDNSIYPELLRSHGWELIQAGGPWRNQAPGSSKPEQSIIWRKPAPDAGLALLMHLHGFNRRQPGDGLILTYTVVDERTGATHAIADATWADWDQAGRLVHIAKGFLFGRHFRPAVQLARPIADLNAQAPTPVAAPAWAKAW